jgi:hypothetical protein
MKFDIIAFSPLFTNCLSDGLRRLGDKISDYAVSFLYLKYKSQLTPIALKGVRGNKKGN